MVEILGQLQGKIKLNRFIACPYMSYCLNPSCQNPQNLPKTSICQSCGSKLLLKERYRAIKPIARGGFGRTFFAIDEDRLNAPCAIKQLLPTLQGSSESRQGVFEKAVTLFNQEAVRLYELGEHPQIPSLLASFEQDKRLYLVQEYIDGKTLWHELKEGGPFREDKICELLAKVLPVLQFVHSKNVIHRDITPVNLLRRKRDGQLILIDFGVAKQLTDASFAKPGTKVGTTCYAPIEQLRSGKAYPASDLYGLGVTCIHLLTGAKPDGLFDPIKGCIWREYLKNRGRTIAPRLGDILDKMIKDNLSDRYQSAQAVLIDLAAVLPQGDRQELRNAATRIQTPQFMKPPSTHNLLPPGDRGSPVALFSKPPISNHTSTHSGPRCVRTLTGHTSWVTCLAIAPNSHILASGSLDDRILIWNFFTGETIRGLSGHSKSINGLAISPDGTLLASCSDDDTIKLWHLNTGQEIATLTDHLRDVNSLAFNTTGTILASGSEDRTVRLWQIGTGPKGNVSVSPLCTLAGRSGMIKSIAIGPKSEYLASGGLDNAIQIWDLKHHKVRYTLGGHLQSVNCLAISPDGTLLVSGSKDKTLKLWNFATGKLITTLSGHRDMVNSVAFSPNGKHIVSGSTDQTLNLWQIRQEKGQFSANHVTTLNGHTGAVNAVIFAPDGKLVISGSWDETIKIWQVLS
ncbi:serine/threonine protein kinase [Laspinema sp. A4]|uniref:serine/threonine-protein kinase n=1 Tax=Laspinema sp. D2d TaxID=2953686 RepID=UPI0021BA72E0|nr:serine/threonine-protein kinase [Laspinema sp. D2d]MCT7985299.1 serine/threonine protein kinase [Laspinema sp. D2d]